MTPVVFVGFNLIPESGDRVYFQDADSYRAGVRFESASEDDEAEFHSFENLGAIVTFEQLLEKLTAVQSRRAMLEERRKR